MLTVQLELLCQGPKLNPPTNVQATHQQHHARSLARSSDYMQTYICAQAYRTRVRNRESGHVLRYLTARQHAQHDNNSNRRQRGSMYSKLETQLNTVLEILNPNCRQAGRHALGWLYELKCQSYRSSVSHTSIQPRQVHEK